MKTTPDTQSLDLFPQDDQPKQEFPVDPKQKEMSLLEYAAYMESLKGKGKSRGPSKARLEETGNL